MHSAVELPRAIRSYNISKLKKPFNVFQYKINSSDENVKRAVIKIALKMKNDNKFYNIFEFSDIFSKILNYLYNLNYINNPNV